MSPQKANGKRGVTSNSDWMSQLPPELHSVPLFNLAIPGSHDTMTYDLDINSPIIEPDILKRLSKIYCVRKIVRRWAVTQEVTITKQLDAGVRYFDLRIARKRNDTDPTRLYFYHGLCTRTDVETVLKDICDWAQKHPKEILILALSNFKGFDKKIEAQLHSHLISFIKTLFGDKLILEKDPLTLKSCWERGRNVMVSYDYPTYQHPEIWKIIRYSYGNSMDPEKIKSALTYVLEKQRPYKRLFVCGLNLTLPSDVRILKYILRLCGDFISVIQKSLPRLLQWVKQQSSRTPMNIVATDLVTRNNFVSMIVELNLKHVKAK